MTALDSEARALVQRQSALDRANKIRVKRAEVKREIKAGTADVNGLLMRPDDYMRSARVLDVLAAIPGYGPVRVTKLLEKCRVPPSKTLGTLTPRQRLALSSAVSRSYDPCRSRLRRGTAPDSQHMLALHNANATRLERAEIKRRIVAGETTVAAVLADVPREADTMTISDLLKLQHGWRDVRTRRFLASVSLRETKTLGSMTERQRNEVAEKIPDFDWWCA